MIFSSAFPCVLIVGTQLVPSVASGGCEASVGGIAFDAKEPTLFSRAVFKI